MNIPSRSNSPALSSVYLDYQATTPVDPRVLAAMMPFFSTQFGNAASQHPFGLVALDAVESAREEVAAIIGAQRADEIVFTSGATESNNLALRGMAERAAMGRRRIVSSPTEHPSVLDCLTYLERSGFEVTFVRVDEYGLVDLEQLQGVIGTDTLAVTIMAANNEIGTVAPVQQIAAIAHSAGAVFHCDATQMVGKLPIDVVRSGVDMLSLSAHKIYGPKGIGALYVSRRVSDRVAPLLHGGGHERGLRSGTLNVPGCVGLGCACSMAKTEIEASSSSAQILRDKLQELIMRQLDGVHLNGHPTMRIPTNLNLRFDGVDADALMLATPEIAISSGSACSSASPAPSHVLKAIGLSYEKSQEAIRFGVGRFTTQDQVQYAADRIVESVRYLRSTAIRGVVEPHPEAAVNG